MTDFKPWPKTPRWNSAWIITEKIDGTNGAVVIVHNETVAESDPVLAIVSNEDTGEVFAVMAQSRTRFVTPQEDNAGFAEWVQTNATTLVEELGAGTHYGEWWGHGIQRGYGLKEKRFSLFNVVRYAEVSRPEIGLDIVPVIMSVPEDGALDADTMVQDALFLLENFGSYAADWHKPEGIVMFHARSGQTFKAFTVGGK